jgi:hypothetical protein
MKLITKAIKKKLLEAGRKDKEGKNPNPDVPLHIFNPYTIGDWFIIDMDEDEDTLFGLCCIHDAELGYVSLKELEEIRVKVLGQVGLPLERDLYWEGTLEDANKKAQEKGYQCLGGSCLG